MANITDESEAFRLALASLEQQALDQQAAMTELWIIVSAIGILGLQAGFALLETGTAKAKNSKAILMKNLCDFGFGIFTWYLIGYGIYQGDNPYFSGKPFRFVLNEESEYALFVQQFGFAVTGTTILSGSVLSRMKFEVYILISILFVGLFYPVLSHWTWSTNGWLGEFGYKDFAGSGPVHLLGALFGIVGSYYCGARVGRFVDDEFDFGGGKTKKVVRDLQGHSATLQVLGVFMLVIGWMFFNAGSSGSADPDGIRDASRALINSVLALSTSCITTVISTYLWDKKFHLGAAGNSILAGLVAVTGPSGLIEPYAACILGVIASPVYLITAWFVLNKLGLDDPVDAFAVHGAPGAVGVIAIGLLDIEDGLFYGGGADLLFAQLVGLGVIVVYGLALAFLVIGTIHKVYGTHVDEDDQLLGLDLKYLNGYAYPEFSAHDVFEYNKTREAALRKMRHRQGSESFEWSENSENSGDYSIGPSWLKKQTSKSSRNTGRRTSTVRTVANKAPQEEKTTSEDDGWA